MRMCMGMGIVWKLHCAGLGLGLRWFMWLRAAFGMGHRRTGSVGLRACRVLGSLASHPPPSPPPTTVELLVSHYRSCNAMGITMH